MCDVPWCCAALLPPLCTVTVTITGAVVALKHVRALLGFFRLWTIENMVIIVFQPPPGAGNRYSSIQGFVLQFVLFPERLGEKRCHLKEITACLSTENKSLLSCQSLGGFISSITREVSPFHFCQTLCRPGFSFIQTNKSWRQ